LKGFVRMDELQVTLYAPLAQLDRASDYESEGREFESLRARHKTPVNITFETGAIDGCQCVFISVFTFYPPSTSSSSGQ
jgi:hypothetical protein